MTKRLEGRELDAKIAVECFGWEWVSHPTINKINNERLAFLIPPEPAIVINNIREISIPSNASAPRFDGWDNINYWNSAEDMSNFNNKLQGFPYYSSNMSDAWLVAEWMKEKGYQVIIQTSKNLTTVEVWQEDHEYPSFWLPIAECDDAKTEPEAICLVALKIAEQLKNE